MKKAVLSLMVAAFAVAMVSTDVWAKDATKAAGEKKASPVCGTLALVKGADGKVTGATITTTSGTVYTVAGSTQDLTALDGKEVVAKGEVKEADGKSTLTVKGDIKEKKEKKEKKEAAK